MVLSRTFIGFSGTDLHYFRLMQAWKNNENIDFNFIDLQLNKEISSDNELYIKRICREKINQAGTFIQLIGEDTKWKYKYVRWEAEVAKEKGCRIIGVNLNGSRQIDDLCPPILKDAGIVFVPFNAGIIQFALKNFTMDEMKKGGNRIYSKEIYQKLGL